MVEETTIIASERDSRDASECVFHHVEKRHVCCGDTLLVTALLFGACFAGCSSSPPEVEKVPVESVDYYERKLLDKSFRWEGPTSREEGIPVLHAARALAYIGDDAVPALLRAMEDERIDINSIGDALSEIGLPAYHGRYAYEISRRESRGLKKWWAENREKTRASRSRHRLSIGLPAIPSSN